MTPLFYPELFGPQRLVELTGTRGIAHALGNTLLLL
jgi:hypothetical protein